MVPLYLEGIYSFESSQILAPLHRSCMQAVVFFKDKAAVNLSSFAFAISLSLVSQGVGCMPLALHGK